MHFTWPKGQTTVNLQHMASLETLRAPFLASQPLVQPVANLPAKTVKNCPFFSDPQIHDQTLFETETYETKLLLHWKTSIDVTFSETVILGAAGMAKMAALANFAKKSGCILHSPRAKQLLICSEWLLWRL